MPTLRMEIFGQYYSDAASNLTIYRTPATQFFGLVTFVLVEKNS